MNILLVDDNATNQKLLRAVLEAEGHAIIEACNGVEALKKLEHEQVDAILSDILMPEMDGYRLCYEVRHSERWRERRFVFYTASYTSPGDEQLAVDLGADAYLRKPTSSGVILETLHNVMQKAERPRPTHQLTETGILKEFSERLVTKLVEKNKELEGAVSELKEANARITKLNDSLECRVRERTAEFEAANEELEAFSYSVSHDLRAPLRAVDGFVRVLLEDCAQLPEKGQRYLQKILGAGQKMTALIDDLLAFSQVQRVALQKQKINTDHLVRSVLADFGAQREGRQIDVRIGNLPACAGDAALLRQVWVNLLSNAFKYTRKREAAVVEVGGERTPEGEVYFVRDNGTGFDMRYADKLFGVFHRLHRAEDYEGTGVGLAIVQRVIHRHGGRVWAEAEVGKGATFYFSLPE